MKRVLLISLLGFLCLGTFAQEKTIKKKVEKKDQYIKEVFHVLKKDKKVKHGPYSLLSLRGQQFANGQYDHGEKSGVWTYYTYGGEIEQEYDHSQKKLVFQSKENDGVDKYYRLNAGAYDEFIPDRPPLFISGRTNMWFATGSRLEYPLEARRKGVQGTVIIEVVITADGRLIQEKVTQGIGAGCEEEALRMIKLVPDQWMPALYKGHPVTSKFEIKTVFKLK